MSRSQWSRSLWKADRGTPEGKGPGYGVTPGAHSDFWFSSVTVVILCSSSVELRRVQAYPAGGLSLREDLQRQRPGLPRQGAVGGAGELQELCV